MLFLEALGSMWRVGIFIQLISAWFDTMRMTDDHKREYPPCASDPKLRYTWIGKVQAWFLLEMTFTSSYVFTMVLLLIKSRFTSIGTDQTDKFDPLYMSLMINKIADSIKFDLHQTKRSFNQTKKYYVNKFKKLKVENNTIYV